jgi:hypothetical protein
MLRHSRDSSGDRQAIDINTLVEEALNLAYTALAPRTKASTSRWSASSMER